jgi:hypothetical protein
LDEFKKPVGGTKPEKLQKVKEMSPRSPEEIAVARKVFDLYTMPNPKTTTDSLRRTPSWLKKSFNLNQSQFIGYIKYMGGSLRSEDIEE